MPIVSRPIVNRDVFWSALEATGSALFSVVAAFVIARLIGPAELGIGAAAVATHVLLWVAVNALFADAIVQRESIDDVTMSSGYWAGALIGCAAAAAQAASGWLLAWLLDDPRMVVMAALLAVPLPFVGMGGALQGRLTRERRYRGLAARTLIGQGSGMVLGLTLAFHGAGAWAPVLQQATGSIIAALVLIAIAGWRPLPVCHWAAVRSLLRIGLPLTASTLLQIGRYRVFAILIGGTAGAAPLGQVHMAFRMVDTVREITFTAMWRLLLPILSEHQRDQTALRRETDRLLRLSSLVTMPLCGGLAVTLDPVTELMLGPAWHGAALAARPLVALMVLAALMFPSAAALIAVGQARYTLYSNLVCMLATIGLALLVRPETAWTAALVWCVAQVAAVPYNLWVNGRALGCGPLRPLRAGIAMSLVSGISTAAALAVNAATPAETLFWRVGVFALALAGFGLAWLAVSRSERWRIAGAGAPERGA